MKSGCVDAAADAAVDARLDDRHNSLLESRVFYPTIKGFTEGAHNFFFKHNSLRIQSHKLFS